MNYFQAKFLSNVWEIMVGLRDIERFFARAGLFDYTAYLAKKRKIEEDVYLI
jgi:hypothetical protein